MALSIPKSSTHCEFPVRIRPQFSTGPNGSRGEWRRAATIRSGEHSGIDQEAYAEALTWADQQHFLEIMVRAIAAENLEDGSIYAALTADAGRH